MSCTNKGLFEQIVCAGLKQSILRRGDSYDVGRRTIEMAEHSSHCRIWCRHEKLIDWKHIYDRSRRSVELAESSAAAREAMLPDDASIVQHCYCIKRRERLLQDEPHGCAVYDIARAWPYVPQCLVKNLWSQSPSRQKRTVYENAPGYVNCMHWRPEDFVWQNASNCFEIQMDCKSIVDLILLRAQSNDGPGIGKSMFRQELGIVVESLADAVHGGWTTRWDAGSWVKWVPRVRNKLADSLCNEAMDVGKNLFYEKEARSTSNAWVGNFLVSCDGGRRSVSQAAAAWCIHGFIQGDQDRPTLLAAGAIVLQNVSSLEAELRSLQEGVKAIHEFVSCWRLHVAKPSDAEFPSKSVSMHLRSTFDARNYVDLRPAAQWCKKSAK